MCNGLECVFIWTYSNIMVCIGGCVMGLNVYLYGHNNGLYCGMCNGLECVFIWTYSNIVDCIGGCVMGLNVYLYGHIVI